MSTASPFDRNKTKEAKLGALITEPGEQNQRDAVHIAVVPIEAATILRPGQHIGVTEDGKKSRVGSGVLVGIVDPFLDAAVGPGQVFWLFLYQGSVTTLRHEWTHPAFPAVKHEAAPQDDLARAAAERRMRAFAEEQCGLSYKALLERAIDAVEGDGYIHMGDQEGISAYAEFMADLAILTGKDVAGKEQIYFSCAC